MQKFLFLVIVASCASFAASKTAFSLLHADIKNALTKNEGNLVEVATGLGLTELVKTAVKVGLGETLATRGPFTLFGPTNRAFASLPPSVKHLLSNITILTGVVEYHVLEGKVFSKDLKNDLIVPTLLPGYKLRINIFKKKSGSTSVTASCRTVVNPDQEASNGVIHVLNGVMLPPPGTVADLVSMESIFSTLLSLVAKAGLVETLSGPGPFTVFAPTNDAFAKLPPALVEKLMKDPELLKKVLLYHVVAATACSVSLEDETEVKTVEGDVIKVSVSEGIVKVGPATVVYADANVTNGVVHVIDTVLIPPTMA